MQAKAEVKYKFFKMSAIEGLDPVPGGRRLSTCTYIEAEVGGA